MIDREWWEHEPDGELELPARDLAGRTLLATLEQRLALAGARGPLKAIMLWNSSD